MKTFFGFGSSSKNKKKKENEKNNFNDTGENKDSKKKSSTILTKDNCIGDIDYKNKCEETQQEKSSDLDKINSVTEATSLGTSLNSIVFQTKLKANDVGALSSTNFEILCSYMTADGSIFGSLKILQDRLVFQPDEMSLEKKMQKKKNKYEFVISFEDALDVYHFKIPKILDEKIDYTYYIQISVSNVGYYPPAKQFYKDLMDSWKTHKIPIANVVLKIEWASYSSKLLNIFEKLNSVEELCSHITDKIMCNIKLFKNQIKNDFTNSSNPTKIPFYDINFELSSTSTSGANVNLKQAEGYIVVFENIFGLKFKHFMLTDIKNHSLLPICDLFYEGLKKKKEEKTVQESQKNVITIQNLSKIFKRTKKKKSLLQTSFNENNANIHQYEFDYSN